MYPNQRKESESREKRAQQQGRGNGRGVSSSAYPQLGQLAPTLETQFLQCKCLISE